MTEIIATIEIVCTDAGRHQPRRLSRHMLHDNGAMEVSGHHSQSNHGAKDEITPGTETWSWRWVCPSCGREVKRRETWVEHALARVAEATPGGRVVLDLSRRPLLP